MLHKPSARPRGNHAAFTLVELMVVILIISILMTVGIIGISGLTGGKSVSTAVSNVEALVDEARSVAIGRGTNARVMVCIDDAAKDTYLKRVVVAYAELDTSGKPTTTWTLSSRGYLLPDRVFFSKLYSKKDQSGSGGTLDEMTLSTGKQEYQGKYLFYEFNSEGICTTPGASFIIGSGARPSSKEPMIVGSAKRDFGGFVIWRNGRTSLYRSPQQMGLPDVIQNF